MKTNRSSLPLLASLLAGTAVTQASTDYAPATWRASCNANYYTTGSGHKFAVIHDMEGYYASTLSMFAGCGWTASSVHYLVNGKKDATSDYAAGDVSQMVRESQYAWHVTCWNTHCVGTEHEGFASNPAWYTEAQYDASADLQKHLASTYGFAKDRNHIVGHNEKSSAAWRTYASANLGIDPNCNTHSDPGQFWDWTHFMALINGGGTVNPPYYFDTSAQGWTAANSWAGPIMWTDAGGWTGVIYQDQVDTNPYFTGPNCNFAASSSSACVNVSVYPQGGTTANHELQFYWKTAAEDFFDSTKASPLVTYTKQDAWTRINLDVGSSGKWGGQTITKCRLDFDDKPFGVRFIVGHVYNQVRPIEWFNTDAAGWTTSGGLGAIQYTSCCGWPGVIYADQTTTNPYFVGPAMSGTYMGGANDNVQVQFYAQNGTNAVHDAQVYWQTTTDATWSEGKSSGIKTWSGNNQWVTVVFPVGQNSNWSSSFIKKLRVDVDDKPTGIRWLVNFVVVTN
jgi:N-acetyl-anhydromuramyl-L-alanine amidase AmpD